MIEFSIPETDVNLRISFSFPDKHKPINKQKYTNAYLYQKIINKESSEDYFWNLISTSVAKCFHGDQFTKYKGRKQAFTKLLNDNFDRKMRRELWKVFLNKYGMR